MVDSLAISPNMFKAISKLFSRPVNPTSAWPVRAPAQLTYELKERSLNGYKLNGPFVEAQRFGQCDVFEPMDEFLDIYYRASGLGLEFANQELIGVILVVAPGSDYEQRGLLPGHVAIVDGAGQRHELSAATKVEDLVKTFGPVKETDPGKTDTCHSFMVLHNFIDAYFSLKTGTLLHLEICETADASAAN